MSLSETLQRGSILVDSKTNNVVVEHTRFKNGRLGLNWHNLLPVRENGDGFVYEMERKIVYPKKPNTLTRIQLPSPSEGSSSFR